MGCVTSRELHCDVKILILDADTSIPNAEKSLALTNFGGWRLYHDYTHNAVFPSFL